MAGTVVAARRGAYRESLRSSPHQRTPRGLTGRMTLTQASDCKVADVNDNRYTAGAVARLAVPVHPAPPALPIAPSQRRAATGRYG